MKKNFIMGMVIGGLIFGSIGAFAGQYVATDNPFPVQLNGKNISVEGYNIEGSTYFKLRDIADAIGGFDVGFQNDIILLSKDGYRYDTAENALGPAEIGALSRLQEPTYEQYYGFPVYSDGTTNYVKLVDVNSILLHSGGTFDMWTLTATSDKSHWRVEYMNVMNDDMYYNKMVYAMDGGILYHNNAEYGYYVTLDDYLEKIKPYIYLSNGIPESRFTYQKESNVSLRD